MDNAYTRRELENAAILDGEIDNNFSKIEAERKKLSGASNKLLALATAEDSPMVKLFKAEEEYKQKSKILCAVLISVNAYRGVLDSLGVNLSDQDKEVFFNKQIEKLSKDFLIDFCILKKIFLFSEKLITSEYEINLNQFEELLIKDGIDKSILSDVMSKIVSSNGFDNNVSYQSQDKDVRKNHRVKIEYLEKKILLPKYNGVIDFKLLNELLKKNNSWFNPGLKYENKVDIFYVTSRLIFVVLGIAICKTILKIDKNYKELIVEKLNKTDCSMGGDSGLHDHNLLGEISTHATKFGPKIKITATSNAINDYIELYHMFKKSDLCGGADIEVLLAKNISGLLNKLDEKNLLQLNKLLGIDEGYFMKIVKQESGVHIFTIFEHLANKMSDMKDSDMKSVELLPVYELVYNMNPNNLLNYAEKQIKKETPQNI